MTRWIFFASLTTGNCRSRLSQVYHRLGFNFISTRRRYDEVETGLRSFRLLIYPWLFISTETPFGLRAPPIFSFDTLNWMSIFPLISLHLAMLMIFMPFFKCLQLAKAQGFFYQKFYLQIKSFNSFNRIPEKSHTMKFYTKGVRCQCHAFIHARTKQVLVFY